MEKSKKAPVFCPTEKYSGLAAEVMEKYRRPENEAVIQGWLGLMKKVLDPEKAKEKWSWTRIDEIMEYARVGG
jgi:hypothetical protein